MKTKYSKLITKDFLGNLIQLLPETKTDLVIDASSRFPVSSKAVYDATARIERSICKNSHLDVVLEKPSVQTTSVGNHSFISWLQNESWTYTINTQAYTSGAKIGQIPFCLYGLENVSVTVDWGDGTVEKCSSENAIANTCPTHTYSKAGDYSITVYSMDFDKIYLRTNAGSASGRATTYARTLKSVDTPLPRFAGVWTYYYDNASGQNVTGNMDNSLEDCFYSCSSLSSIVPEIFVNNASVTSLQSAFSSCTSLTEIPYGIFDEMTEVLDFNECFYQCTKLKFIDEDIFVKNKKAEKFSYCFFGCSGLNNFRIRITSPSVSYAGAFCSSKSGTSRIVYVPADSTTYATFTSNASSYGFIVEGVANGSS